MPVALEDVAALDQHLAVSGDANRASGDRASDRPDALPSRQVDGRSRAGFGEPIALEHGDADAAEEVAEPSAERCSATDRPPDVASECGAELGVDQPVEDGVPQPQQQARATGVERLAVCHGRGVGEVEEAPVALGRGFVLGGVVDLLEHARHRKHCGRLELHHMRDDVLDVAGVREVNPVVHRAELHRPGQDVRERQELQRAHLLVEDQLLDVFGRTDVVHVGQQVSVRDRASLGSSGRAGGVDDRGEQVAGDGVAALHDCFRGDVAAGVDEPVDSVGVDDPHLAQLRRVEQSLDECLGMVLCLDECRDGP